MQTENSDRRDFIKKVYAILVSQLLFTVLLCIIPFASESARDAMRAAWPVLLLAFIIMIGLLLLIFCKRNFAKRRPQNMIALVVFTLAIAYVTSTYDGFSVLMAAVMTLTVTFGLTIYAWTTKKDFTTLGGCIVGMSIALVFFAILIAMSPGSFFSLLFILIVIGLYCVFIVYDT
jgi:FtsH-binding integral membrane protein